MPSARATRSLGCTYIGIALAFGLINLMFVSHLGTCCDVAAGYIFIIGFMLAVSNFILGFSMEKIIRSIMLYDYQLHEYRDHVV